jgi:hypothetical protein
MKELKSIFLCIFFLAVSALATHVAVLETMADGSAKDAVSYSDRQYMTNVLREQAVQVLPAEQNYTIMTRENIQQMLPPGKSVEDCEGSCLVETGKNISADYICQARLGSFGGALTLSAELYETAGNKLVASFNGRGADVNELLELIKQKSPDFFRRIKSKGGFGGVGGIAEFGEAGNFNFAGNKKFIVEIVSTPTGAVPTIDGKAIPKCLSTPCKVQVEGGNHRFVMSKEQYEDAEVVMDIKSNNQRVELTLSPNFGWLEVKPTYAGDAAKKGSVNIEVDGTRAEKSRITLDPGVHNVRVTHPCYDPAEFKVSIAKNKTEVFNKEIPRGVGGLELNAEYNGVPQAVAVFIDGVESGSTPYTGEVPLCADVTLRGNGWVETVNVKPRWHEVVQVTHALANDPDFAVAENDATRARAKEAYAELDGKPNESKVGKSIPAEVSGKESNVLGKVVLGIGAAAAVTGVALAVLGNNKAKDAAGKSYSSESEYKKNHDDAESGQTMRKVGIGLAIVGAIGVGVSFAF